MGYTHRKSMTPSSIDKKHIMKGKVMYSQKEIAKGNKGK
jgi:hypothetical protein